MRAGRGMLTRGCGAGVDVGRHNMLAQGCVGCVGACIMLTHGDVGAGGVGTGIGGQGLLTCGAVGGHNVGADVGALGVWTGGASGVGGLLAMLLVMLLVLLLIVLLIVLLVMLFIVLSVMLSIVLVAVFVLLGVFVLRLLVFLWFFVFVMFVPFVVGFRCGVWLVDCVMRWSPCRPDGGPGVQMDSGLKFGWVPTKEKIGKNGG